MKKELILWIVLASLVIISLQNINAVLPNSCNSSSQVLLKLSHNNNSHGELANGIEYQKYICFDEVFGFQGTGNRNCLSDQSNSILRLSDSTNAHAQVNAHAKVPLEDNSYDYPVCYEGLSCGSSLGNCPAGYSPVVSISSISSDTNAHIAEPGFYDYNICCTASGGPTCNNKVQDPGEEGIDCGGICPKECSPTECILTGASWSTSYVREGENVFLTVKGSLSDGNVCLSTEQVSFEVWESDVFTSDDRARINPQPVSFAEDSDGNPSTATGSWIAEWTEDKDGWLIFKESNPPEYYFKAKLLSNPSKEIRSSEPKLIVTPGETPTNECDITSLSWDRKNAYTGDTAFMEIVAGDECLGDEVSIKLFEQSSGDEISPNVEAGDTFNLFYTDGARGDWEITGIEGEEYPQKFYFEATIYDDETGNQITRESTDFEGGVLNVLERNTAFCYDDPPVVDCSGYTNGNQCNDDVCNVNEDLNSGFCSQGETTDEKKICEWKNGACVTKEDILPCSGGGEGIIPNSVGQCTGAKKPDQAPDDCSDGFITVDVTRTWDWAVDNICRTLAEVQQEGLEDFFVRPDPGVDCWRYDPENKREGCKDGTEVDLCPAKIRLPFFGRAQLVVALVLIGVIYGLMILKKRKRTK